MSLQILRRSGIKLAAMARLTVFRSVRGCVAREAVLLGDTFACIVLTVA
jgi:hypothetical protein